MKGYRSSMSLHIVDSVVIVAYFLIMLSIGVYFSTSIRDIREYFGGGGKVPWWLSGFSFYMTSFSAFAFVIYSQLAYQHGWTAITVSWMSTFGALLSAWFFATRWRRVAKTSALEFVEERFGKVMRQGLVWVNIPLRTIDNGLKIFVIGTLVAGVSGLGEGSILPSILFCGIIVFIYTVLGGLWAVVVTDFVQAIVMLIAVVVLLPLALFKVGGISGIVANTPEGFFALTNDTFTPGYLLAWVVLLGLNYSSSWSLVQRYYSVETDRDAKKVGYLVAFLHFVVTPMMFLPAMAARVLYPDLTETETEQVYAMLCKNLLPIGMIGMLISAMFAASMSMISGEYNAIASVMTNDVYKRLINPKARPEKLVFIGRITTFLIGFCCIGVALIIYANPEGRDLFDLMVKIFSIFLPPIAVPMLAGLLSRRVSNVGGLLGLILGMAVGLLGFFLGQSFESFAFFKDNQFMIPCTIGASLVGIVLGTILIPASEVERERIDQFFVNMEKESEQFHHKESGENQREGISPLPIIGFSTFALGVVLLAMMISTVPLSQGKVSLAVGIGLVLLGLGFFYYKPKVVKRNP